MSGILISITVASFIALQASWAGAPRKIVLAAAGVAAGFMAAFWALAMQTLFPTPDLWTRVPRAMVESFALAGLGAVLFTASAASLIQKITRFKEKYPER